jgi:hypothetical protein
VSNYEEAKKRVDDLRIRRVSASPGDVRTIGTLDAIHEELMLIRALLEDQAERQRQD